ncbi:testis-expressed protein 264 isoform X1 [Prionailurus bengalensis]|uniref:testis-expressed protein 264 isoform X1 n=1 Tax=Prionailurus bengalensis TaxID=37029 RepID=UPI001CA99ACD|nr:testis-expressed protein 264 isoform X1 [Prionailurus bengalensis]XP_043443401.1 testis-expressed protein 264 isoform X1 [Prionailurus bengalensis]
MSDLLLLGLIVGLTLLLLLTLLAFAGYSGLLSGVVVSAGSPPIRNVTVAYKFHVGPYSETGRLFTESCSVSPKLRSIAVYYDNPHMVPPEKCRCAVGSILSEGEESPSSELIQLYQKFGFKVFSFPAPSHVVTATFPYTSTLSIWLATRRVHPALDAYIKGRKLCAHPRLEIYQQDQIYFMCPLARQGDFYVPEVKETERKSRGPAEATDAQMDGTDTWIHVDVDSHMLPLATQIQRPCLDSLQMQQGVPLETELTDSWMLMGGRCSCLGKASLGWGSSGSKPGTGSGRYRREQVVLLSPGMEPSQKKDAFSLLKSSQRACRGQPEDQCLPLPPEPAFMSQVQASWWLACSQPPSLPSPLRPWAVPRSKGACW